MTTDPIADMLTRLRNALRNRTASVVMPFAKTRLAIAEALKREGYVSEVSAAGEGAKRTLTVKLKYGPLGEKVIQRIERVSSPGRRFYRGADELPRILDGMGTMIVSTPKGILSDREARKQRVGGELICKVW